MTRSQKPGSNAASARDRVPAGFFTHSASRQRHGVTPCAAKTPAAAWKNPHGGAARIAETPPPGAGFRMQAQAPSGHDAVNVGAGEAGAIEMSSGGRTNSLRIRRVAAYTAHSSVASPESRTTSSSGAEGRNGKTGGSRVRAAEYLMPGTNSGRRSSSSAHPRRGNHTQRDAPENAPPPHFPPKNTRLGLRNVGRTRIRLSSIFKKRT